MRAYTYVYGKYECNSDQWKCVRCMRMQFLYNFLLQMKSGVQFYTLLPGSRIRSRYVTHHNTWQQPHLDRDDTIAIYPNS